MVRYTAGSRSDGPNVTKGAGVPPVGPFVPQRGVVQQNVYNPQLGMPDLTGNQDPRALIADAARRQGLVQENYSRGPNGPAYQPQNADAARRAQRIQEMENERRFQEEYQRGAAAADPWAAAAAREISATVDDYGAPRPEVLNQADRFFDADAVRRGMPQGWQDAMATNAGPPVYPYPGSGYQDPVTAWQQQERDMRARIDRYAAENPDLPQNREKQAYIAQQMNEFYAANQPAQQMFRERMARQGNWNMRDPNATVQWPGDRGSAYPDLVGNWGQEGNDTGFNSRIEQYMAQDPQRALAQGFRPPIPGESEFERVNRESYNRMIANRGRNTDPGFGDYLTPERAQQYYGRQGRPGDWWQRERPGGMYGVPRPEILNQAGRYGGDADWDQLGNVLGHDVAGQLYGGGMQQAAAAAAAAARGPNVQQGGQSPWQTFNSQGQEVQTPYKPYPSLQDIQQAGVLPPQVQRALTPLQTGNYGPSQESPVGVAGGSPFATRAASLLGGVRPISQQALNGLTPSHRGALESTIGYTGNWPEDYFARSAMQSPAAGRGGPNVNYGQPARAPRQRY